MICHRQFLNLQYSLWLFLIFFSIWVLIYSFTSVSEAGVIILPTPDGVGKAKSEESGMVMDVDPIELKWPPKSGISNADLFDSEDSWYDSPPEEFNLTVSCRVN